MFLCKKDHKNWAHLRNFQKNVQCKPLPMARKIAQSGHPGWHQALKLNASTNCPRHYNGQSCYMIFFLSTSKQMTFLKLLPGWHFRLLGDSLLLAGFWQTTKVAHILGLLFSSVKVMHSFWQKWFGYILGVFSKKRIWSPWQLPRKWRRKSQTKSWLCLPPQVRDEGLKQGDRTSLWKIAQTEAQAHFMSRLIYYFYRAKTKPKCLSYFCIFFYKTFHGKQLAQIRSIWSPWLKATKRRSVIYTQAIWLFLTIWQLAPGKYLLPRDDADPWGVNTLCWTPFCPKLSVFTLRGELSGKGSPRGSKLPPPRGQVNP
jgi:hypothetical protein